MSSRLGMGGTDLSFNTVMDAMQGSGDALKVLGSKLGGSKNKAKLNAVNMLGYSPKGSSTELGQKIWDGLIDVEFGALADGALALTNGDSITLSDKLLTGGGKEESGQIASLLDHEHAHMNGFDEMQSRVNGYDTYNVLSQIFELTGEGYDDITDIAYMTEVLKNGGEEALFNELFFSDAFSESADGNDYYIAATRGSGWTQKGNTGEQGIALGGLDAWTQDEVNKKNATEIESIFDTQKEKEYTTYLGSLGKGEIAVSKDAYSGYTYTDVDSLTVALNGSDDLAKTLGYKAASYDSIYSAGCTLATVAYIAFSLGGEAHSFENANELIGGSDGSSNLFVKDAKNGDQQNLIGGGKGYADAVNRLAGGDVIKYITQIYNPTGLQLDKYAKDPFTEYVSHLRVAAFDGSISDAHSVLLKGLNYETVDWWPATISKPYSDNIFDGIRTAPYTFPSSAQVIDPIRGEINKAFEHIARADIFEVINRILQNSQPELDLYGDY